MKANLLYIRDDGKLFVQFQRKSADPLRNRICPGMHMLWQYECGVTIEGTVYAVTTTGAVLTDWSVTG